MKRYKILSNILRSLSWKTEDHKNHEDHKNLAISLSSEDHKKKARLTLRPLQYEKFVFSYVDLGNDYYGLTNYKNRTVFINPNKPLAYRIWTIGHESLHVWINEASKGLDRRLLQEFTDSCLDILDSCLSSFNMLYKTIIQPMGFKKGFIYLIDYYGFLFDLKRIKRLNNELKNRDKSTYSGKAKISGINRVKDFIKRRLS